MALTLGDNFSYQGAKPLDARLKYDTLATMKAVGDATMYEGCMAYCVETDKEYQWKSTNTVDADTGKWREFSSGGGGGASSLSELEDTTISEPSNGQVLEFNSSTNKWENKNPSGSEDAKAYHTDDTAETTIADTDYFPFYDTSATAKRKSLWSNIKSVLKTYFDTLYDLNKSDIPFYATSSTGASTTAKVATVSRGTFTLVVGAKVTVKFTNSNTASAPTLNVGSTGAKNIKYIDESGTVTTPSVWWNANEVVDFVYDGTQFIMMPTYTMALTPKGNKIQPSDIYSTTEKVVGKWTDGRPLYQKTFSGTLPTFTNGTATTVDITTLATSIKVVNMFGFAYKDSYQKRSLIDFDPDTKYGSSLFINSSQAVKLKCNWDAFSGHTYYVTIQYTKTSDSTSSYNLANPTDYSTSEKEVGTWIDGKPLYQKTIAITLPTATTAGTAVSSDFAIGVSVKNCVYMNGWFNYEERVLYLNDLTNVSGSIGFVRCQILTNSFTTSADRNKVRVQNAIPVWSGCKGYVTIQYTKP